jgi:hypothetical protein
VRAYPSDVFSRSPFCADRYPYFDLCITDSPPGDDYSNGDIYSSWYSDTICNGHTYIGSFFFPERCRGSAGGLIRFVCLALDIMYTVFCPSSRAPASPWRLFCRSVTAVAVMTRANLKLEPAESNQPLPKVPNDDSLYGTISRSHQPRPPITIERRMQDAPPALSNNN